jgi:4-amino-4-deoxy-L-arabinose transferase-like glycosyltransferase
MPPRDKWALLILIIGLLLRLPLVPEVLAQSLDAWRQADTAAIARNFLHGGFRLFYPQIDWGGAGPGYVETELQLYPFCVALLYALFGEKVWLGRLLSALLFVPAALLFHRLARRLLAPAGQYAALVLFAASPLYLRYGVAFMPEATVLCLYLAALLTFWIWLEQPRPGRLLLCGALTALAILVKPTSIHIGLVYLLLILSRLGSRGLLRPEVLGFGLLSLTPPALWYWHAYTLFRNHGNTFGILSGGDSKFGGLSYWLSPGFYARLASLDRVWLLTEAGLVLFLIGLGVSLRRRRPLLIPFGTLTLFVYYLIVARYAQEKWGLHYHIYALPYAALGGGLGLEWLLSRATRARVLIPAAFGLLFALRVAPLYAKLRQPAPDPQVACAAHVARLVPEGGLIIVSATTPARVGGVPNNYQDPILFFYSRRRGFSLAADRHSREEVLAMRRAGGRHLVIQSPELWAAHPELARYLSETATQIGPGIEKGCGIYRFMD